MKKLLSFLILFICLLTSQLVEAKGTMRINGSSSSKTVPDSANLSLGFEVDGSTSAKTQIELSNKLNSLAKGLKNIGLTSKEMKLQSNSIQPVRKEYNSPITSYRGYGNIQISLQGESRLALIPQIKILGEKVNANQIGSIEFYVSPETKKTLEEKIYADAVQNALSKAEDVLKKLDLKLTGIQEISFNDSFNHYEPKRFAMSAALPDQAIREDEYLSRGESTIQINANLIIEFDK